MKKVEEVVLGVVKVVPPEGLPKVSFSFVSSVASRSLPLSFFIPNESLLVFFMIEGLLWMGVMGDVSPDVDDGA